MKKTAIFYLAFLALPLAFVGIPIYLNIADFYAQKFGLNLVLIGSLLAFIRFFDAIQDPFIGYYSDVLCGKKISRRSIIIFFSSFLAVGFYLVFNPPQLATQIAAAIWFTLSLSITYLCFNFVIVNFESMIALLARDDEERIKFNSLKEFLGVVGMILAFLIPGILAKFFDQQQNYFYLSLIFVLLILCAILLQFLKNKNRQSIAVIAYKPDFNLVIKDKKFLAFLGIFLLNSISVSLPAANMNFYVRDVLQAEENIAWFLTTYFTAACLFIPLWRFLFSKFGIINSWIISIIGAVATFGFAYFLDAQNSQFFFIICLLSGIFLGADLIAAPAIMAQITSKKNHLVSSYFSLWNFFSKMGLMLAASGSLIILGFFNYHPGNAIDDNLNHLSILYAAAPCFIKISVAALLLKFKKL